MQVKEAKIVFLPDCYADQQQPQGIKKTTTLLNIIHLLMVYTKSHFVNRRLLTVSHEQ